MTFFVSVMRGLKLPLEVWEARHLPEILNHFFFCLFLVRCDELQEGNDTTSASFGFSCVFFFFLDMINHNKFTPSQMCFSGPLFEYKWMTWQSQISILFAETDRQRGRGRADGQDWQKNLTPNANIAPCCFCDLRRFWLFSLFCPLREKRPSRRMMLVGLLFFFLARVKKTKTKPICAQAVLQTSVVQSKTKMIYLFIPVSLEVCSFAFWTSSSCDLVDGRRWEWWTWTLMPLCFEGRCQNIWWLLGANEEETSL